LGLRERKEQGNGKDWTVKNFINCTLYPVSVGSLNPEERDGRAIQYARGDKK
jgi:hypothetical protein